MKEKGPFDGLADAIDNGWESHKTSPLTTAMLMAAVDAISKPRERTVPYCIQAPGYAEKQTKRLLESDEDTLPCVFCGGGWIMYNGEVTHVNGR